MSHCDAGNTIYECPMCIDEDSTKNFHPYNKNHYKEYNTLSSYRSHMHLIHGTVIDENGKFVKYDFEVIARNYLGEL